MFICCILFIQRIWTETRMNMHSQSFCQSIDTIYRNTCMRHALMPEGNHAPCMSKKHSRRNKHTIVGIKAPRQTDSRRLSRPLTIHTVHGAHYQNHRIACLFYMTFSGFLLYSFEITFKAILPFLPLITKGLFLQKLVAPHPQQKNRYRAHSRCQAPIEILI